MTSDPLRPLLVPMGEAAVLVRFSTLLSDDANLAALALARRLHDEPPEGVVEIDSTLVSVLVRFDPFRTDAARLSGELRLLIGADAEAYTRAGRNEEIDVAFGGEAGPDLDEVAGLLGMSSGDFVARHNAQPLRVLTIGFAPGFIYCGFHDDALRVPRRPTVRRLVPAGTVLFAAGQTAITATPIPTGWHVIGHTPFSNFDAACDPPTRVAEGDRVLFRAFR